MKNISEKLIQLLSVQFYEAVFHDLNLSIKKNSKKTPCNKCDTYGWKWKENFADSVERSFRTSWHTSKAQDKVEAKGE